MAKVSILIPSRKEQFLVPTVNDVLRNARGEIEVIVVLDGYWEHGLPNDPRLKILHEGTPLGMRPAINHAAAMATGEYLLKCDGHVSFAEGFDEVLKAEYQEQNWILVPRRYPLDPETWAHEVRADHKYPIDAHYLSEPFERHGDSTPGLHGTEWRARRDARAHVLLDEEMTSQGSCWFMSRKHWGFLAPLDIAAYGSFWHEFQEIGLKTWLSGGQVMVTKRTSYAHLYKGKRYGRGYSTRDMGHEAGTAFCTRFWMTDQPFSGRTRTMRWLLERFWPVPTWTDLEATFKRAHDTWSAHAC
jgi:glycosyltransferase involved in cell wall biosynthesis